MDITKKITAFLMAKEVITEEDREIYEYGFELIFADIINFLIIILLSALLQDIWTGVIYLACFLTTRTFCGGFHAKTHARCRFAMFAAYALFAVIRRMLMMANWGILLASTVLVWIPVIRYAPIAHENKPMSHALYRLNRRRAFFTYGVWTVGAFILTIAGEPAGVTIFSTLWIVSLSMILAIQLMRRKGGIIHEEV